MAILLSFSILLFSCSDESSSNSSDRGADGADGADAINGDGNLDSLDELDSLNEIGEEQRNDEVDTDADEINIPGADGSANGAGDIITDDTDTNTN